jgi:hypothetical protein
MGSPAGGERLRKRTTPFVHVGEQVLTVGLELGQVVVADHAGGPTDRSQGSVILTSW